MVKRKAGMALVAIATTVSLAGCGAVPGLTVEQIPLPAPGGIGDAITVHTSFANALNLPDKAKVKLGGVDVGEVESIVADNYRAEVTMTVSKDSRIPVGTGAELRQATPLGDVFVALETPDDASRGYVADGGRLTGPTSAAATVEDLLVSMTGLVDSGSVGALQRIFTELSTAVGGNAPELRGAIKAFTTAFEKFNANAGAVDEAMATTAHWSRELADGREQIAAAVNKIPPAIDVVNDQLELILSTLDKSNKVTAATNDFLNTGQDDLTEMLGHLNTTLIALRESAPTFGPLADRLRVLNPKWAKATPGSAAVVSAKVYWLTTGAGFDSASRLPEIADVTNGMHSMEQTIARIIARLTGTKGCCEK
ncbi:MCE family protein [Gordonia shandongensis]|uniref:MCE family protein n=1 Tax=Gordonia shandongensis TaxID=376351 RepID=UPI00041F3BE8